MLGSFGNLPFLDLSTRRVVPKILKRVGTSHAVYDRCKYKKMNPTPRGDRDARRRSVRRRIGGARLWRWHFPDRGERLRAEGRRKILVGCLEGNRTVSR